MSATSIIAIIGSGSPDHRSARLAVELGALVARSHCHLLTGGGDGVMLDAARGFTEVSPRAGISIGIIPRAVSNDGPKSGYPNRHIELPILTHLAGADPTSRDSRNPINVLTPCCVLALPGDAGTRAEARLAKRYGTPIAAVIDVAHSPTSFETSMATMRVPCLRVETPPDESRAYDLTRVEEFIAASPTTPAGATRGGGLC